MDCGMDVHSWLYGGNTIRNNDVLGNHRDSSVDLYYMASTLGRTDVWVWSTMNDADIFFGPKPTTEMPTAQITHFARYPDVQDLCDTFIDFMGWHHDAYTIQQIVAGARDFKLAIGNRPDILLRSLHKMEREKMSIGSPRSCITYGREMLHSPDKDSDEHRQKYLKGVDDE